MRGTVYEWFAARPGTHAPSRARCNVATRATPRRVPPLQPNNVRMGEDNGKRV